MKTSPAHHLPAVRHPFQTRKGRAEQAAAFADLVRWCRAHHAEHIDDCGEVDVTGLAIACAEAFGCDDPPTDHPAWDAATSI